MLSTFRMMLMGEFNNADSTDCYQSISNLYFIILHYDILTNNTQTYKHLSLTAEVKGQR